MPEASGFKLWNTRKWKHLHARSGTRLERRPYYYKISEDKTKILLISAVDKPGLLKASDYLQLDRNTFEKLKAIVKSELGSIE